MNEPSTSPIIMGLLFALRCLIPLGILFGISYLLRRLEVFSDQAEEAENAAPAPEPTPRASEALPAEKKKTPPLNNPKPVKKKKPAAPKKRSRKQ